MTEPRLATHILVSALIRQAEAQGGFATLLRKGDPTAGTILLVQLEKGQNPALFERLPAISGPAVWGELTTEVVEKEDYIRDYLARRAARDPDIWVLELYIPFAELFTEIIASIN